MQFYCTINQTDMTQSQRENFGFKPSGFLKALLLIFSLLTTAMSQNSGFDTSRMDTSVDACQDFFQYANGSWLKNTEIPAERSVYGSSPQLNDANRALLREILEAAAKNTKTIKGSNEQLIGDYYGSCLDEGAAEKAGAKPLEKYLQQIDSIKDLNDLRTMIASLHNSGFQVLFNFRPRPDIKNSSVYIANAEQAGLSLPNRNYYIAEDAKSAEIRVKFVEYLTNMFKFLGESELNAKANAETVMRMQTHLARASKDPTELRNPENSYHKMSLAAANEITPNFQWDKYISERAAPAVAEINIAHPDFFREASKMMTDVPLGNWKTYLKWLVLNSAAPALSKKFVDERFNFFGRYLSGAKEQQPRWVRCVLSTSGTVPDALDAEYVKRAFKPSAQKKVNELIDNLFAAFRERLSQLEWMSPQTRQQALVKLNAFGRKIGFNQNPRGYVGLKLDRKSYLENALSAERFLRARDLQEIGKPVDKSLWSLAATDVNAYYSSNKNEIGFPAGLLQPPYFNEQADDAINYGAIGSIIGHEITHGFDDKGSRFDAVGNLQNWWTPEDRAKFEDRAACLVNQFNGYEFAPGLFLQGKLTLGENIADLGGLEIAYAAFQKSLEGKTRPVNIDGFTPEQRFFLGFAQVRAEKYRAEAERLQAQNGPHSLPRWRTNGPLSNLPQFARAFGCKKGDGMVRSEVCRIW